MSPFGRHPITSVELHLFRGRMFVTGQWGGDWGQAIDRGMSPEDVGRLLLGGLAGDRARRRPLIDTLETFERRERAEERGWARFCEREVGVSVREYRPEVRVEVLDLSDGMLRVRPIGRGARPGPDRELSRDVDARALGEAALEVVEQATPQWPAVRRAFVNVASRDRFAIFPSGNVLGSPRVVSMRDGTEALSSAVLAALVDSKLLRGDDEEAEYGSPDEWEATLRAAGLSSQQLARRRAASVGELANGTIEVAAWRARTGGGWEPVDVIQDGVLTDRATVVLEHSDRDTVGGAVIAATTTWNPWGAETLAEAVAEEP